MTRAIISGIDHDYSKRWQAETDRRLRHTLVQMHMQGAPPPTDEDIQALWAALALDAFTPIGKPQ